MTPEEFERLSDPEREAAIAKHRAETLVWGVCQRCRLRIETLGKDFPSICPRCGHGG